MSSASLLAPCLLTAAALQVHWDWGPPSHAWQAGWLVVSPGHVWSLSAAFVLPPHAAAAAGAPAEPEAGPDPPRRAFSQPGQKAPCHAEAAAHDPGFRLPAVHIIANASSPHEHSMFQQLSLKAPLLVQSTLSSGWSRAPACCAA